MGAFDRAGEAKEPSFSTEEIDPFHPLRRLGPPLLFIRQQLAPPEVRVVDTLSHIARRQCIIFGSARR
jgi:hypothetical protein